MRGYDTYGWVVALKSRYLVDELDGALQKLAASESIGEQKANLLRVALSVTSPQAEALDALRAYSRPDKSLELRLTAVRAIDMNAWPESITLLEGVRDSDPDAIVRRVAAAAVDVLKQWQARSTAT